MIIANNIDDLYASAINEVITRGTQVTARGLTFKEVLFQHLVLTNPRARVVQNPARKLSQRFMIGEFIWIMSGRNDLEMISHYSKNYSQFSDDGIILHGAYGPRLRSWQKGVDQLKSCLERLKNDSGTRQAVIIILDPSIDFTVKTKDVPCNDLLQFFIRDNKLHCSCYVRSNDLHWGLPYDIFYWTMLQELYASILDVELGEYHHFIGSMHIYDKDYEKMDKILDKAKSFVHVSMAKMPKEKNLFILNILSFIEEEIRTKNNKESLLSSILVSSYWKGLLQLL